MWKKQRFCGQLQNHLRIANFRGGIREITTPSKSSYFFVVLWHGWSCKEMCGAILWVANRTILQLNKVSAPCIDVHHFEEEMKSVGELSQVCFQIVLKCWYLARIGRPDILWSVNKLARSITKWTKACDKRLNRMISYIHHTCEFKQCCYVGNTANNADGDCFKTPILREILRIQNPHQEEHCAFWKSYVCTNQLDVQETNFSLAQFNSIRNHLFGRRIEIRRYSRSCPWKHNSEPW